MSNDAPAPPPVPASESPPPSVPPGEPAQEELDDYEPLTPELVEEEAIRGDFVLRWAVVLLALLLGSTRIGESPTLVHVKTGQYLADHGLLPPANDVFSYTATERPWTNLSWGFDLLSAGIHKLGGFAGLSVAKALLAAITFFLIIGVSRPGMPTWWGSVCAVVALLACHLRLTAQPILITLLGMALVMWLVHHWQQPGARKQRLWLVAGVFLAWSNLDERAFLGLTLLVLYAVGESLAGALKMNSPLSVADRKQLWQVIGASVVAMVIHPFGYKSLLGAWQVYGVQYPALRDYIQGVYSGGQFEPSGTRLLIYFSMFTDNFWRGLELPFLAGLLMLLMAAVAFVLNWGRLELGHALVYLGCLVMAVLCIHELPLAAMVCAVLATLNGQAWYAGAVRQTYSIETSELLFSRGGRVITVLAFAAVAFFGGTGRLRDTSYPRTGFGIDQTLATSLEDLQKQLGGDQSFDHRPFNVLLAQGDQLIWVDEQVFADNRAAVYYAPDNGTNLLAIHQQTRDALRQPRDRSASGSRSGSRTSLWKSTFDEYKITHIVSRLLAESPAGPDYEALVALLQDERTWQWTSLGSAAAVLYRKDLRDPELKEYLAEHQLDFRKQAYRERAKELLRSREEWVRAPSVYQKYFWSRKREIPGPIQEALHLVRLASMEGFPRTYERSLGAICLLAVRKAQAGLDDNPDSPAGYLALGQAYQLLALLDARDARNNSRSPYSGTRYLQSVAAYNQALVADPDPQTERTIHNALSAMYQNARRLDLAIRHLEALETLMAAELGSENAGELERVTDRVTTLKNSLELFDNELATAPEGDAGIQQRVEMAVGQGCLLRALQELDKEQARMSGSLDAEKLRITLLMECGRAEEAWNAAERFAEPARREGINDWANIVALANLPKGGFIRAADLWKTDAEETSMNGVKMILATLPPRSSRSVWPLGATQSTYNAMYMLPEVVSGRQMDLALLYLEEGQLAQAEESFRAALHSFPETANRPLIAYYLYELTGTEEIDILPPSETIPALFAPDEGEEDENPVAG
ncbi:MAG: hypothetical protein ACKV0T_19890 [Planctomycetales bacterium]